MESLEYEPKNTDADMVLPAVHSLVVFLAYRTSQLELQALHGRYFLTLRVDMVVKVS